VTLTGGRRPPRSGEAAPSAGKDRQVYDVDLLVIGSGPGGQKAAIAAAKLGKRVCLAERRDMMGGVCVNTGTIPSKTLREAVLYLTGFAQRDMYGASYRVKSEITIADLLARTLHVVGREVEVIRSRLLRNHVDLLWGTARFEDPQTLTVCGDVRGDHTTVTAEKIVIATGTKPARPPEVEFDDERVLDSDGVLRIRRIPGSIRVWRARHAVVDHAGLAPGSCLGSNPGARDHRNVLICRCAGIGQAVVRRSVTVSPADRH
jgi:NAD(P) transhydrogenase